MGPTVRIHRGFSAGRTVSDEERGVVFRAGSYLQSRGKRLRILSAISQGIGPSGVTFRGLCDCPPVVLNMLSNLRPFRPASSAEKSPAAFVD